MNKKRYSIEVARHAAADEVSDREMEQAVAAALDCAKCPSAQISVAVVSDFTMAALHKEYLGDDGTTDVLSFDLRDDDAEPADGVEGEIIVSIDTARRTAVERNMAPKAEFLMYLIHGVLHLAGYDDSTEEQRNAMFALQDRILTEFGYDTDCGALPK